MADGALPLGECSEVLGDALRLLASKELRVTASKLAATDDDGAGAGEGGPAAAAGGGEAAARARGRLVGALIKRHLVEGVVPLLVELRHIMQVGGAAYLPGVRLGSGGNREVWLPAVGARVGVGQGDHLRSSPSLVLRVLHCLK